MVKRVNKCFHRIINSRNKIINLTMRIYVSGRSVRFHNNKPGYQDCENSANSKKNMPRFASFG